MSLPSPSPSRTERKTQALHCLLILIVAVVETRALWESSFLLWGHSAWLDATKMVVFNEALRAGQWLPGWIPHFYFHHGSPLFLMYSPLAYYFAELWVLLGFGIGQALKLTQLSALLLSGVTMYRLCRERLSPWAACLGGFLYMLAPYRIVDMSVRHALAEHLAFAWYPLVILGTERFVSAYGRDGRNGRDGDGQSGLLGGLWLGGIASAGLILTHNISAMIGLPVCVALGWALAENGRAVRSLLMALVPSCFGIGATAFFWWPAMRLRRYVRVEDLTGGYFDFHHHFASFRQLIELGWGYGQSGVTGGEGMMSLQLGWVQWGILGAALGMLLFPNRYWSKAAFRYCLAGLLVALGSLLMCLRVSVIAWEHLPLLCFVQFPWRFLGLAVLGVALCGAAAFHALTTTRPRLEQLVFWTGMLALLISYWPYYSTARFLAADPHSKGIVLLPADRLDELASRGAVLSMEKFLSPQVVSAAGDGATSQDDFLPAQVREKPAGIATPPLVLSQGGTVQQFTQIGFNDYQSRVGSPHGSEAEFSQFWFPGWEALVDGTRVPVFASGPQGLVACQVPSGAHEVRFRFNELALRGAPLAVSLTALLVAAVAVALCRWPLRGRPGESSRLPASQKSMGGKLVALRALALKALTLSPAASQRPPTEAQSPPTGQLFIIFGLGLLIYGFGLGREFVFDDIPYISANPLLRRPDAFRTFFFTSEAFNYYPVFWSLLRVQWLGWGDAPFGYQFVNLLLHCANGVLVWKIVGKLRLPGAFWAGCLFVVHPVNVQTVAWAAEQKNTWSFLFMALAMLSFINWVDATEEAAGISGAGNHSDGNEKTGAAGASLSQGNQGPKPSWVWYAASLGWFTAALGCKPSVVALPVFLAVAFGIRKGRLVWGRLLKLAPFFLLGLASGLCTIWFEAHRVEAHSLLASLSLWQRLCVASANFWFYLGKALVPVGLTPMYAGWSDLAAPRVGAIPLLALLTMSAFGALFWRKLGAPVALGLFYYAVMLLPLLGVFDTNYFKYSLVADHWQYHALPGVIVAALFAGDRLLALPWLRHQWTPARQKALGALAVLGFAALSGAHLANFEDAKTLWSFVVTKNPEAWMGWYNLGNIFASQRDYPKAIAAYERCLRIDPSYYWCQFNLADTLAEAGRLAEADQAYRKAERLPDVDADAFNNHAVVLLRMGKEDEAMAGFEQALRLAPAKASAHTNLACLLIRRGRLEEVWRHLVPAATSSPANRRKLASALVEAWETGAADRESLLQVASRAREIPGASQDELAQLSLETIVYGAKPR